MYKQYKCYVEAYSNKKTKMFPETPVVQ